MLRPRRAGSRPNAQVFVQAERRGTAHAVLAAQGGDRTRRRRHPGGLRRHAADPAETLARLRGALADGAAVAVLGFRPADPTGYGRLVTQGDELARHRRGARRERQRARHRAVQWRADGVRRRGGADNPGADRQRQPQGRILSDRRGEDRARHGARRRSRSKSTEDEVQRHQHQGATRRAPRRSCSSGCGRRRWRPASRWSRPRRCFLSADTKLGRDVTVEPYVVFGPGVTVEDGATIRSFSHLDGAHVGKGAIVGPYARLRPGAKLEEGVHIGNFVEIKEATIEAGAKANHLSYIGDARGRRGRQYRRRHHHLQLRRRRPSTAPTSARAPSSARTRRWWRRSRSATAPMSGRAR